jgi:hypothetical protein
MKTGGISLLGAVFLVLFVLKLVGKISISWWLVTAPLWGPMALFVALMLMVIATMILCEMGGWEMKKKIR